MRNQLNDNKNRRVNNPLSITDRLKSKTSNYKYIKTSQRTHPPVERSTSSILTNMESKSKRSSNVLLFGLSFNLILTLGSLGFTCYSLHRLDSRVTAVERDVLAINHPYRLANHEILKPTSPHVPQSGSQRKEAVVKRAADSPSMCRKCSRVCSLNSNGHRNVSCSLLCVVRPGN